MTTIEDGLRALIAETVRTEVRRELGAAMKPEEFLSTLNAAKVADVVPATIRRWVKSGKLPGSHAGRVLRVSRAELERFLKTGARANDDSPEAVAARRHG